MGERTRTNVRPGIRAEARCAWCGFVDIDPAELSVHARTEDEGLFEFGCPSCGRTNVRSLNGGDLAVLEEIGVAILSGRAPFELLEPHHGPSFTWDDLIDFHEALSRMEGRRSQNHHRARPGSGPVQERNAA